MYRRARWPFRAAAACLLAALAAGCSGTSTPPNNPASKHSTDTASESGKSAPDSPGPGRRRARSPFASLASYLATRPGEVTAAVYDRATGRIWIFHPGVREDTASIVKVEIMGTALREAQVAGTTLPGTELALMTTMIENSDNDAATQLLADDGGPPKVQAFDKSAGMTDTTVSTAAFIPGSTTLPGWGLTTTTALDEVRLVSAFAFPNTLLNATDRNYGLGLMEHVDADQAWGVSAGVEPGTTVALKNGWLPLDLTNYTNWQVDSIGWIHGNGRDYVLAVLSGGNPDEQTGIDTIDTISAKVYSELGPKG
ncbi:MAG TPA: serine hydrolase [Streptosporangiaceae bacterium]|nr:serine hydrolase [Streptosporangiaceae bacterium]